MELRLFQNNLPFRKHHKNKLIPRTINNTESGVN